MAVSEILASTQSATVGTEHTLGGAAVTAAGVYVLAVDLHNMASGDTVELRAKVKTQSSSTERDLYLATYSDAQTQPNWQGVPVPSAHSVKFTLKQTAGTGRSYDWSVLKL